MKLIVGLGNPGTQYQKTRHNVGFMVVDEIARRYDIDLRQEKFHSWFGEGTIGLEKTVLAKPTTFMNRSGQAVLAIGRFYKLEIEDLLVIVDDLDLPCGKLRMRARGGCGGHRGMMDITQRLNTDDFARLRVGIGTGVGDATHHVLGRFDPLEESTMHEAVQRATDAAVCWISEGTVTTMNRFNAPAQQSGENETQETG